VHLQKFLQYIILEFTSWNLGSLFKGTIDLSLASSASQLGKQVRLGHIDVMIKQCTCASSMYTGFLAYLDISTINIEFYSAYTDDRLLSS
jgi:hypothetical protein